MKDLKITPPEGYQIDKENSTLEHIKFKPIQKKLPKEWRDMGDIFGYTFTKTQIDMCSVENDHHLSTKLFPTKEEAEASIALAQLCQLRDVYNDGWKPNWTDTNTCGYLIKYYNESIFVGKTALDRVVLAFKTEELRDEFLKNFRDLIETAKPLL